MGYLNGELLEDSPLVWAKVSKWNWFPLISEHILFMKFHTSLEHKQYNMKIESPCSDVSMTNKEVNRLWIILLECVSSVISRPIPHERPKRTDWITDTISWWLKADCDEFTTTSFSVSVFFFKDVLLINNNVMMMRNTIQLNRYKIMNGINTPI